MSVISKTSQRTAATNSRPERQPDEHDGIWLNLGVITGITEDTPDGKFVRLPRGVAVSDLKARPVYKTMDPDFAAELTLMNEFITQIKEAGLGLEEGESISIGLEVQLYRKQDEAETVDADRANVAAVKNVLFG